MKTLILFSTSPAQFILPSSHGEMFSLVRLADFLGIDEFVEVSARVLGVSVDANSNQNSAGQVRGLNFPKEYEEALAHRIP